MARNRGAGDAAEEEPLTLIAARSRDLVQTLRDLVWAVGPGHGHLHDLLQRVRRFASDTFAARDIDVEFDLPDLGALPLGDDVRRQVYLIFREAISNAARHSGCRRVHVSCRAERRALVLTLADDGCGFDPEAANGGYGLASMQRRATEIAGSLQIQSQPGAGARLTLHVPL
jgi:signal transduction histidine kinase